MPNFLNSEVAELNVPPRQPWHLQLRDPAVYCVHQQAKHAFPKAVFENMQVTSLRPTFGEPDPSHHSVTDFQPPSPI